MRKWLKKLIIAVSVIVGIYLVMFAVNVVLNMTMRNYIESLGVVQYDANRIVPDTTGEYVTYTTDDDLRIMFITDLHIGGGFCTYKRDRKAFYEVSEMLKAEKPDLVILGGDNTYCIPFVGFNGGNTLNNKMVATTVIKFFEHEGVYFTTVFGNHDTEAIDYATRQEIAEVYMNPEFKYCIFDQNFTDTDAVSVPSVSNQFIIVKRTDGNVSKLILLIDSNAYEDTSIVSTIMGKYDVIHQAQIDWASDTIKKLSLEAGLPEGEYLKTIAFTHIPPGEYQDAYEELVNVELDSEGNAVSYALKSSDIATLVEGIWDEIVCYGGRSNAALDPVDQDMFFETLGEEMGCLDAIFCGHDHTNNAVVMYKGVMLAYGYSIDNIAYGKSITNSGLQRGATIITVKPDGTFTEVHKNAYTDYGVSTDKFFDVYLDRYFYENDVRP